MPVAPPLPEDVDARARAATAERGPGQAQHDEQNTEARSHGLGPYWRAGAILRAVMPPLTADRARHGTYSIVARDPATGELGVAVQSHWFSVGPIVPWARAGVGAVATQANAELSYGPRGLELMAAGYSAADTLATLLAQDPLTESRQVAVVDASGRVAAHTGSGCMAEAGRLPGRRRLLSGQHHAQRRRVARDARGL